MNYLRFLFLLLRIIIDIIRFLREKEWLRVTFESITNINATELSILFAT
jgi:hypothetical protein